MSKAPGVLPVHEPWEAVFLFAWLSSLKSSMNWSKLQPSDPPAHPELIASLQVYHILTTSDHQTSETLKKKEYWQKICPELHVQAANFKVNEPSQALNNARRRD
jgi:hypothetical protein